MRSRLFLLLAALIAAVGIFVATRGWRQRLLEESARSRQVIAAVEQARAAREQRAAREKGLAAALQSHPGLVEVRLELAQLRWAEGGPQAAAGRGGGGGGGVGRGGGGGEGGGRVGETGAVLEVGVARTNPDRRKKETEDGGGARGVGRPTPGERALAPRSKSPPSKPHSPD